jgi:Ca2+-binding EF-hand superfamily protein
MYRVLAVTCVLLLGCAFAGAGGADKGDPKKKAALAEALKGSADDFIKRYDKNGDGFLTKDELPPFAAKFFEKADTNGDGMLDRKEVEGLLKVLRQQFGMAPGAAPTPADVDRVVEKLLAQFDTNKDGQISRNEAKGRLAEIFDQFDINKDGFLDRNELRQVARRFLSAPKGGPKGPFGGPQPPDFDALDRNADGRLTRDELKGTPFEAVFDQIDTNRDGQIDRREFEAYLRKQAKK